MVTAPTSGDVYSTSKPSRNVWGPPSAAVSGVTAGSVAVMAATNAAKGSGAPAQSARRLTSVIHTLSGPPGATRSNRSLRPSVYSPGA